MKNEADRVAVPVKDPAHPMAHGDLAHACAPARGGPMVHGEHHGIALPQGRAERQETRYVYQDSRGNPQQLEVCFVNLDNWAEPGPGTTYVQRRRNVMRLTGMTPELANQLDTRIDGRVDARFGRMRELGRHMPSAATGTGPDAGRWTRNDADTATPDTQVAVMTGYIRMNQ